MLIAVSFFLKVSRPSFIPFWGIVKFERRIPLALAIDIIIEQGIGLKLVFIILYFHSFYAVV